MSQADDGTLYALLLCDPRALEATPLIAQAVADRLGQPLADVSTRVRYSSGFVTRAAERGVVDDIGADLGAQGIETIALPEEELAVPLRGVKVTGCVLGEQALSVLKGHSAVPHQIPWNTIGAIHAYALCEHFLEEQKREHVLLFAETESADEIDPDTKSQLASKIYTEDAQKVIEQIAEYEDKYKDREVQLFIDVITFDPRGLYRIKRRDFNFAGLGELCRQHSMDNYLTLLRELLARCPDALVSLRTNRFLETLDFQQMLLEKEEELRNYDHWVLNLLVHRPELASLDPALVAGNGAEAAPDAPDARPTIELSERKAADQPTNPATILLVLLVLVLGLGGGALYYLMGQIETANDDPFQQRRP